MVAESAAEQDQAAQCQQVGVDDPLSSVGLEVQAATHRRQRDVDDRRVEHDEPTGQVARRSASRCARSPRRAGVVAPSTASCIEWQVATGGPALTGDAGPGCGPAADRRYARVRRVRRSPARGRRARALPSTSLPACRPLPGRRLRRRPCASGCAASRASQLIGEIANLRPPTRARVVLRAARRRRRDPVRDVARRLGPARPRCAPRSPTARR